MLNNMVASFTASNLVGESMKKGMKIDKPLQINKPPKEADENQETENQE
jgi:hypothetical protein